MTRRSRLVVLALVAAIAALPATSALGHDDDGHYDEPYSGNEVTETTLVPDDADGDPRAGERDAAAAVGSGGEQLPQTGIQTDQLLIGGLLAILFGVLVVWIARGSRSDTDG